MAHHVLRMTTVLASALVSATVLAAPKPFDPDAALGGPFGSDEDAALRYVASCSPFTTPGLRLCQEAPLDLDGQPGTDLIVGVNESSPKRFYSGRTDGLFNPPVYFGLDGPTSGVKLADLDADGDLDMVETMRANGTTGNNTVYVDRNGTLASLFGDEQALDSLKHDRSSSVVIGDVNNDGKLDVIVTNETEGAQDNPGGPTLPYGQTNYLYLNQTTTPNTVVFGPALALDAADAEAYTRRGLLIDVEGDGDLDLVVTSADNHLDESGNGNWLYVNGTVGGSPAPGTNPFAAAVPLNASTDDDTDVANAIAAGDIDGDGDPDLVFSTWSRMNGASAVAASNRYYINNSTPGNINFETTGTFGPSAHHTNVRLADFDNDNDPDALVLVFEGANRLHRNTGAPDYFDAGVALSEPSEWPVDRSRGVDVADLNNDASLDVVVVNRVQIGLRYLNNDQCTPAGCAAGFAGPFDNYTPAITAQSTALVPPGTAPIDVNTLLDALSVTDPDNVYPTDFTAVVPQPGGAAEYTCTLGVVVGGPISGTCIDGQITPKAGADANGFIGPVEVKVRDGEDTSSSFPTFTLTVGTGSVPAFTTTSPLPAATEDSAYTTTISATDNDGNHPLVFESVNLLPTWLELVADTETSATLRSITPPGQGHVGLHTITLVVRDSSGLESAPRDFALEVANVNDAPSVTTTALPDGTEGQAYSATVTGNDEDGTTPTFAATGLPSGLSISTDGAISGTPTVSGAFAVDLTATDGLATSDPVRVNLTIQAVAPPPNAAPTFTAPGPQSGTVGQAFNLSLAGSASDADGDPLTFAATGLPSGITISATGLLSGSPTTATGSPFSVTVTVSDGKGGQASGTFQFTISNPTSSGGGSSGGGGGALGLLELLALLGMAALVAQRRQAARAVPRR